VGKTCRIVVHMGRAAIDDAQPHANAEPASYYATMDDETE
jgi:hypothetical protein